MQVKCVLCDSVETIKDFSPEAKKLRNRRIHMYMCNECNDRIDHKTKMRHATGKFNLYKEKRKNDDLI